MLRNQPDRSGLLLDRASLYLEHKCCDLALKDYQAYAKVHPDDPAASFGIARVLVLSGHLADAETHFRAHLKRFPGDAAAHFSRSAIQADLHQLPAAIASCRMAIKYRPAPLLLDWLTLIRFEESLGEPDLQTPRGTLREALAVFPSRSELLEVQISLAEKVRDWPAAIAALDQLMQPLRRKEMYLARKAVLLEKSGDPATAVSVHRQTLAAVAALPDFLQGQEHVKTLLTVTYAAVARLERPASVKVNFK